MPAAETYRVPVPRTRNEPKSATVARARVPPYFRRRYGGRRVPPRRGGSTHTKYRRYTNSTRRAYLRRRSAQSPRKTGSRSRNCTLHSTISYPHSTITYLHSTISYLHCTYPYRTRVPRPRASTPSCARDPRSTLPAHAYPFVASPEAPRRYAASAVPPAKVRRYPRSRYRSRFRLVSGTRYGYAVRCRVGHAILQYPSRSSYHVRYVFSCAGRSACAAPPRTRLACRAPAEFALQYHAACLAQRVRRHQRRAAGHDRG